MKSNKEKTKAQSANLFPVVGIGASAGGLDAFKKLLKAIPENSGMAFVLVQHLDPKHESMLPDLLQKVTNIPVVEIADDIKVEPNHIYVIPSNKMMVANDGVLQITPRPEISKSKRNLPIDLFFTSLAEVHHTHAIGVVLSGTASDGTAGLKAIKDYGGITFAQDEASAAYEGMPHSAIQAGVVDFILPPEEIPQKLLQVTSIINGNNSDEQNLPQQDEDIFKQIISLLRIRKGTDFTYYKQTTIRRRILRRMALNKNEEPAAYLKYIRENKAEQDVLYQDLLIPVTSFFRDTKSFDNLCESVFPLIVKNKTAGESIRIWVAGCSTGEEAYSIAICFKEYLGKLAQTLSKREGLERVQIFATDISEPAIAKARSGMYSKSELDSLAPQRLQEFFTKTNGSYQVNKQVRDMCVFAVHNFLKDPPFGKMDLISCRNVLIYMEAYLQKKALTTFHYSLNPKGFLLLGKSETTSGVPELFSPAAKNDKLFSRKDVPGRFMHVASQQSEQNLSYTDAGAKNENVRTDFQKTADDIMLSKYTPAGVVVNEAMDIVHFRGNTASYLEQSPGKPSHNLLKMAKDGLAFELRNILHKVKKSLPGGRQGKQPVIKENIPLQVNGSLRNISIEAIPLPNTIEPYYLVLFHDSHATGIIPAGSGAGSGNKKTGTAKAKKNEKDLRIHQLEKELELVREDMRSITEDQEAVNEELQSANEELLSGSEELQSLNEELETNKEELQSTNEELTVVNYEMISLNEHVTEARNYSESIVATVRDPLLVLDKNLRIKSANNAFYKTFLVNELETEGKLIYELGDKQWDIPALRRLLEEILPKKTLFADFEVRHFFPTIGERIMLLNARQVTKDSVEEKLILLSIEDVTESKQAAIKLAESEFFNRTILENSPDCVQLLDAEGRINFMNANGQCLLEIDDFTTVKNKYWWKIWDEENRQMIKDTVRKARNGQKSQFQAFSPTQKGNPKWWDVIVLPMQAAGGVEKLPEILSVSRDITEQKQHQLKEKELLSRFQNLVMQAPVAICILHGENYLIETINERMIELWGRKEEDILNKPVFDVLPELRDQGFKELLDNVYTSGERFVTQELPVDLKRNGKIENAYVKFVYEPLREADGTVSGVMALAHEITDLVTSRKRMEAQATMVRDLLITAPGFVCTLNGPDHVYDLVNERYQQLFGKRKIKGKPLMQALPELEGQGFDTLLDKVYTTGEPYIGIDIPITLARDENLAPEIRYFNFSYQPMYDKNNIIYSILVFGYEVTDQVVAKNKILEIQQNHALELEEKVRQRTLELSEANGLLQQKNEELGKMNKELELFTYVSSHDLQEPLRKIQTFANRIGEKENKHLSDTGKDYFIRMQAAASRMQQLIEDLLAFSRIKTAERNFENTDLTIIVDKVKVVCKDVIDEKHATIEITELGKANIIPFQFQQLVQNLMSNALKFSKPGTPPRIIIAGRNIIAGKVNDKSLLPGKEYFHFSFSDNGIGFDPQYKEQVFEVFQRLHAREEYSGTGIGLAIVKKIVENHGGIITATSELEKGSTFDIYIPA